jgi:hypothetical protein
MEESRDAQGVKRKSFHKMAREVRKALRRRFYRLLYSGPRELVDRSLV